VGTATSKKQVTFTMAGCRGSLALTKKIIYNFELVVLASVLEVPQVVPAVVSRPTIIAQLA
jgi:hypothetical protein